MDTQALFTDEAGVTHTVDFQGGHLYALTQYGVAEEIFKSKLGIDAPWNKIVLRNLPRGRSTI